MATQIRILISINTMKKNIWISLMAFIFSSCLPKIYKDDFTIKPVKLKKDISNNFLKINGAFYASDLEFNYLNIFFFYENNLQRNIAASKDNFNKDDISGSINKILKDFNNAKNKNQYFEEGGYRITDSIITFQGIRYMPQFYWGVVTYTGKIINDSTFLLNSIDFPKRNFFIKKDEYYHFIKLDKPDSILGNQWKNEKWYWAD